MVYLGLSEEDAKRYTYGSKQKVIVRCPNCNREKEMEIHSIYSKRSIACICDSNGISYAERFMSELLRQLNINYKFQLTKTTFDWVDNYMYDFYFELDGKTYIIETHGRQHYEENKNWTKTLKETQENDKEKEKLAKNNGIDNYIVINCRYSYLSWIKKYILDSELVNIINMNFIDWDKCNEFASGSLIKEVCEYWNKREEWETTTDLAKTFNVHKRTIRRWLKKGMELNLTYYDSNKERRISSIKNKNMNPAKKSVEVFKDNVSLGIFNSINELSRKSLLLFDVAFTSSGISLVCRGEQKYHKGFTFKYTEYSN